jgi:hypothetical protein
MAAALDSVWLKRPARPENVAAIRHAVGALPEALDLPLGAA